MLQIYIWLKLIKNGRSNNLSGNLNEFVLSSSGLVSFILKKGDDILLQQSYEPGPDNLIRVDVQDVVEGHLTYTLNAGQPFYIQNKLAETFVATIDGTDYSFRVIRSGVANLADTAANWLKLHFLTWQPRVKPVTYYSPEWLTYYAVEECTAKLKATYPDKSIKEITLGTCVAGHATTMNLQYSVVAGKLGNTYPSYYEVWTENSGTKLSESQVYAFSDPLSEDEQWYLFENSLGGLDTFRAAGTNNLNAEHEHNIAVFGDVREEYQVDTQRKYTKNTGYLDEYSRRWLLDFFPSKAKFVYEATAIRKIVVTESNVTYISNELPSSYTFTWQLSEVSSFLNLTKNESDIPDNLVAPDLSSPDFILPPRLAEFSRVQLTEGVLIPAFDPFNPKPTVTTYGAIHNTIKNAVIKELEDEIGNIGGGGSGGDFNVEIIESTQLGFILPTDKNLYSAYSTDLRIDEELEDFLEEIDNRYLRKDTNDIGYGFYEWKAGWMTQAPVRSAEYNIGWEVENPTGWYVSETGTAWYTSLNVRGPILSNGVIGSPYYVSGWTGYGSQWDMVNHRLETDYVSVRKELRVYALDVFRIYGTNGDLAVSTTNKIDRVEDMGSVWRCHINDYDGEMYMNMRIDDVVKCQTWEKLSGRYYMARVTNIDEKWFELSKTLLEGTTTPAPGDVLIRWSNLTNNDRKGLLYLSASDSYAPYMDVRFGDWNATVGTIKVRNGRLDGINDPLFPELYGAHNNFGLYTTNFYGTGELILRSTGESVSRTFEVLKDSIKMGLDEVRYELQVSQGSVLVNPAFQDGLKYWEVTNVYYPWVIKNNLLQSNYKPFMNFVSGALIVTDEVINRPVMQVADGTVIQRNASFTTKTPGKYSLRFTYRSLLPFGSLEIGVPGAQINIKVSLSDNATYQKAEIIGDWDGTGDFIVKVNGAVNISDISFVDDKLANAINEVKTYYDTKLTFYAEKAVMDSFREEYDEFNRVVRKDYATQTWTYNAINTEVGTIVNGKLTNYSTTTQTARMIENKVVDLNLGQYATQKWTSSQITNSVKDLVSKSTLEQTAQGLTLSISSVDSKANKSRDITEAFYKFSSESMQLNRRIEVGSVSLTNYFAQGGISPNVDNICFWAGGNYWEATTGAAKMVLRHDGSGWLAGKNITWDTAGNVKLLGSLKTYSSGALCEITGTQMGLYNNDNIRVSIQSNVGSTGFNGIEMHNIDDFYLEKGNVLLLTSSFLRFGRISKSSYSTQGDFSIDEAVRGKYTINNLWPSINEVSSGSLYKDSSGYLKVKTS